MNMAEENGEIRAMIGKCLNAPQGDLLRDVTSYNDSMTISQVVKFFERQGAALTKPMIQHYIRVGLLPPPVDKRRYTRFHLLLLAVIEEFKSIYALEDLAAAFSGLNPSDHLIGMFRSMTDYAVSAWRETLNGIADRASEMAGYTVTDGEAARQAKALLLLGVMAQSAAAKEAVSILIGDGGNKIRTEI